MLPFQLPRKPKLVLSPGAIVAFQATFLAVATVPAWVTVAFQVWVTFCPLAKVQFDVQPWTGAWPVARTVTSPWKPPGHWFVIWYVAVQDAPADGDGELGVDAVADGDGDGPPLRMTTVVMELAA